MLIRFLKTDLTNVDCGYDIGTELKLVLQQCTWHSAAINATEIPRWSQSTVMICKMKQKEET